jgi:dienelactone hydrolase
MDRDELGDVDVAREVVATVADPELFLYPGDRHLFTDPGSADHDADAAALVTQRVLGFLRSC